MRRHAAVFTRDSASGSGSKSAQEQGFSPTLASESIARHVSHGVARAARVVREVTLSYRERKNILAQVARPGESGQDQLETYISVDVNDAAPLRHLGVTNVNSRVAGQSRRVERAE